MDEISESEAYHHNELDSQQDLANILNDMFPDYQANYWNSQVIKTGTSVIHVNNDTLDLSLCSQMGGNCHHFYQSSINSAEHSNPASLQHVHD